MRPLPVKEAVAALEELGLRHVRSYIGTGNFVFESRKRPATLAREIEACIEARFGFDKHKQHEDADRARRERVAAQFKAPGRKRASR